MLRTEIPLLRTPSIPVRCKTFGGPRWPLPALSCPAGLTPGRALPASGAPTLAWPSSPASKRGPELPGELEKHWQAAPPPGLPRRAGRAVAALRLGPAAWAALAWGGEAGAAACLSAGAGAGSCVSGSRPSPPPPPPAGPPAAAARPPRGLAGCRLHRRGFAPFSRPLRLPELIWELFISCQKAAGPAERATLAAGPPGLARCGRPGPLPPGRGPRGLPGTPNHPGRAGGRARGGGTSPAHLVTLRSPEEASSGLLPAKGCGGKLIDFNDRFPVTMRGSS